MTKRARGGKKQVKSAARKAGGRVSGACVNSLPDSTLMEIFFRLPIIVIMNCKCVCKRWRDIISEYGFAQAYRRNAPFTPLLLDMSWSNEDASYLLVHLLEISDDGNCFRAPIKLRFPCGSRRTQSTAYMDLHDGLLSLPVPKDWREVIYICNPITGESIVTSDYEAKHHGFRCYAVGFCPAENNIKVLRVSFECSLQPATEFEILTVGVDRTWRRLSSPIDDLMYARGGIYCKGAFHWINKGEIIKFDLAQERFGRISLPAEMLLKLKDVKLKLFDGKLGFVDFSVPSQIAIWTMENYNVAKSWIKDVILESWFPSDIDFSRLVPVEKLRNGDVLFLCYSHLLFFDVKQRKCSDIQTLGFPWIHYHIMPYTPSFRSLEEALTNGDRGILHGSWSLLVDANAVENDVRPIVANGSLESAFVWYPLCRIS